MASFSRWRGDHGHHRRAPGADGALSRNGARRGRAGVGNAGTSRSGLEGWVIAEARTRTERGRGLLGCDGLGVREGLWLPVRSVHTIGMRFALDLVWLDRDGRVVRLDEHVGRGRVRTCPRARGGVVELAAGSGAAFAAALRPSP